MCAVPPQGQTALITPVPAADPILAAIAAEYPDAVRPGIPAHVSLLYPFLPADELDGGHPETSDWLTAFAVRTRPVRATFTDIATEPGFAYLSSPELTPLSTAIREQWPEITPYGGRFGAAPVAHLTVAMDFAAADTAGIVDLARQFLPLTVTVEELWLLALATTWRQVGRFRFTGTDR
jgi:hypothetical protein